MEGTDKEYTGQGLDGAGLYFHSAWYYDADIGARRTETQNLVVFVAIAAVIFGILYFGAFAVIGFCFLVSPRQTSRSVKHVNAWIYRKTHLAHFSPEREQKREQEREQRWVLPFVHIFPDKYETIRIFWVRASGLLLLAIGTPAVVLMAGFVLPSLFRSL